MRLDLPARGVADERDVRDDLELEQDVALQAGGSEQRESGSLALRGGEGGVAESALAAGRDDEAHAGLVEVDELVALGVLDDGADRNGQHQLLARGAGPVVAHARAAVARDLRWGARW